MSGLLEGIVDPEYVDVVSWIIIAAVALLLAYAAYRIVRLLTSGTFIAGGRNRRMRLAVMDATAVDDKRRLVLVRRDDVEHLILIGGPTDVVVEQDIRMIPKTARPLPGEQAQAPEQSEPVAEPPRPIAAPVRPPYREGRQGEHALSSRSSPDRAGTIRPRPAPSAPQAAAPPAPQPPTPQPASSGAQAAAAPAPVRPGSESRPAPDLAPSPARSGYYSSFQNRPGQPNPQPTRIPNPPPAAPSPAPKPAAAAPRPVSAAGDLDEALLQELEESLDLSAGEGKNTADKTLDDEMSKLFGELSGDRKQAN